MNSIFFDWGSIPIKWSRLSLKSEAKALFDSSWIVREMSLLSMLTVEIPKHGSFSLLHPGVIFWEENREDILPLLEEE